MLTQILFLINKVTMVINLRQAQTLNPPVKEEKQYLLSQRAMRLLLLSRTNVDDFGGV